MGAGSWYKLVYILLSAKRRACKSIATEIWGVSRYFSRVLGSGVDLGWNAQQLAIAGPPVAASPPTSSGCSSCWCCCCCSCSWTLCWCCSSSCCCSCSCCRCSSVCSSFRSSFCASLSADGAQISTPNMTGRRFHRTTEAIPRRPWKARSPFASRPIRISIKKGTRGMRTTYNTVLRPYISIVRCSSRPVIPVPENAEIPQKRSHREDKLAYQYRVPRKFLLSGKNHRHECFCLFFQENHMD